MKQILPNLAWMLVAASSPAIFAQSLESPQASAAAQPAGDVPTSGAGQGGNPMASPQGQALARRAIAAVESQRSVYLQIRQRISMFGQQLVGTGFYQQFDEPDRPRRRLDLKVKIADQTTSMQQVCNGRFLYIRREFGESSQLGRVDLRRIREAVAQAGPTNGNLDIS